MKYTHLNHVKPKNCPNMNEIGKRVKYFREQKNWTQEHIASKLHISQNSYSRIESGVSKLTVDRLLDIADILKINVSDLIGNEVINGDSAESFEKLRMNDSINSKIITIEGIVYSIKLELDEIKKTNAILMDLLNNGKNKVE